MEQEEPQPLIKNRVTVAKEEQVKKGKTVYIEIDRLERVNISEVRQRWEEVSIYRVSPQVAKLNPAAYTPQLVSIGPYHNGKPHLRPMEEPKYRALFHVLKRSETEIQDFLVSLREVAQQLMNTYEELDLEWRDEERFLELMVLDGCFLLELLRANAGAGMLEYGQNDPIFSLHGVHSSAYNMLPDLVMVENQLPMLALERLVAVERCTGDKPSEYIKKLVLQTFMCDCSLALEMGTCLHILDITRKLKIGGAQARMAILRPRLKVKPIKCASQLNMAGITYRRGERNSLADITFQNGVLHLPLFHISPVTESILLNLIAFERLHPNSGQEISSYVKFVAGLIRTAEDAKLLVSRGTISTIGSCDEVAEFIHKLQHDMNFVPRDTLFLVQSNIEAYYSEKTRGWSRRFREWGVHFKEKYFKSPWSLVALIATIFLLALTVDQTIFTNLSFYKSR